MKPGASLRISAHEMQSIQMDTSDYMVVDVRGVQHAQNATTKIPGATALNPAEFTTVFPTWDPNKWYFLYCA